MNIVIAIVIGVLLFILKQKIERKKIMEEHEKEVYFHLYCPKCKYEGHKESDDPCWDCLNEPMNQDSHKPVYFKEKKK